MAPFRRPKGKPDGELEGRETGMAPFHPQRGCPSVKAKGNGTGMAPFHPQKGNPGEVVSRETRMVPFHAQPVSRSKRNRMGNQTDARGHQESRRRHKRQQHVENPESAQEVHRQPRWQEATSGQTQRLEEELKEGAQVPWHLTHLEEMTVPAFSHSSGSFNNNALPTH